MHEPCEEGGELEIVEDDTHAAHKPRQATGQCNTPVLIVLANHVFNR